MCFYRDGNQGDYEDFLIYLMNLFIVMYLLCSLTGFATMCYLVHCILLLLFNHFTLVLHFLVFQETPGEAAKEAGPEGDPGGCGHSQEGVPSPEGTPQSRGGWGRLQPWS